MSKMITAGLIGFMIGTKCNGLTKKLCLKKIKRDMVKMMKP